MGRKKKVSLQMEFYRPSQKRGSPVAALGVSTHRSVSFSFLTATIPTVGSVWPL